MSSLSNSTQNMGDDDKGDSVHLKEKQPLILGIKAHQCTTCLKLFACKSNLERHVRIHTAVKPFKCTLCNRAFALAAKLKQHLVTHDGNIKCDECKMRFIHYNELAIHMSTIHPDVKPHSCDVCGKTFIKAIDHKKHWMTHFVTHVNNAIDDKGQAKNDNLHNKTSVKNYRLTKNNAVLVSESANNRQNVNNKMYNFIDTTLLKDDPPHNPSVCVKFEPLNIQCKPLEIKENPFNVKDEPLDVEDEPFNVEDKPLDATEGPFGVKDKPLDAEVKTFDVDKSLNAKGKSIYVEQNSLASDIKPHQCTICFKGFATSISLKRHMHVHSSPHQCTICSLTCAYAASLKRHMLQHSGERPHQCSQCDKGFTTGYALRNHQKTHSGIKEFKCDVCNREFARKPELIRHKFTHSDYKPYKCDVCDKGFATATFLKYHIRRHSGIKAHKCDVCPKEFYTAHDRNRHVLTHYIKDNKSIILKSQKGNVDGKYPSFNRPLDTCMDSNNPIEYSGDFDTESIIVKGEPVTIKEEPSDVTDCEDDYDLDAKPFLDVIPVTGV